MAFWTALLVDILSNLVSMLLVAEAGMTNVDGALAIPLLIETAI